MTAKEAGKLERAMKAAGAARMIEELEAETKHCSVHMRLTETDKAEMSAMAEAFGLSLTEYLVRLHRVAQMGLLKLATTRGKSPRSRGTKKGG